MTPNFSTFSESLVVESAFAVLRTAKRLISDGKDVIELEIGDSPFPPPQVAQTQLVAALDQSMSHYCPSLGTPEFRSAAAEFVGREFGIAAGRGNVSVAPGGKPFEQYFCEAFIDPGDGVLVFSPQFPTYEPNILRRGGRMVTVDLSASNQFRPRPSDVASFVNDDPNPKAIFLNSPHNPTGGVMTEADVREIADIVRGRNIAVFSDEPYCHMVWEGQHHSIAAEPGLLDQCVAAYTFSKSYSMSGWRLGFAVASLAVTEMIGKMINTSLSCTPPFLQHAGTAVLRSADSERDHAMDAFRSQVYSLADGLNAIDGICAARPVGTFYVFADVSEICRQHKISSHTLAMYWLEGADPDLGVACLGGECFGSGGAGFIRFSCAESTERLEDAVEFIRTHSSAAERIGEWAAERRD